MYSDSTASDCSLHNFAVFETTQELLNHSHDSRMPACEPVPLVSNFDRHRLSESRIETRLHEFLEQFKRLPSQNELSAFGQCRKTNAKAALKRFLREQGRAETQTAYIDNFNSLSPVPKSIGLLPSNQRRLITLGTCALFDHCPNSLWLLTVTSPTDSELLYLALCYLSAQIPKQLLEPLLPDMASALYCYRWELQPQNHKQLHLHLLVFIPDSTPFHVDQLKSKLKKSWLQILDALDEQTGCNPFVDEYGFEVPTCDLQVDVRQYAETADSAKYKFSYLAKRLQGQRTVRKLKILNGRLYAPKSHGAVSPALNALIDKKSTIIKLPSTGSNDVMTTVEELKSKVIPCQHYGWREITLRDGFKLGQECKVEATSLHVVRDLVKAYSPFSTEKDAIEWNSLHQEALNRAMRILVISLTPDRLLKIYSYRNQKSAKSA